MTDDHKKCRELAQTIEVVFSISHALHSLSGAATPTAIAVSITDGQAVCPDRSVPCEYRLDKVKRGLRWHSSPAGAVHRSHLRASGAAQPYTAVRVLLVENESFVKSIKRHRAQGLQPVQ
jgi:hypothetical protein